MEVKMPTSPGFFIGFSDNLILLEVVVMIFSSNIILSFVIVKEQLADRLESHVRESVVEIEKLSDGKDICILLEEDRAC